MTRQDLNEWGEIFRAGALASLGRISGVSEALNAMANKAYELADQADE